MATIKRERAQNREIQNPKVKEMIVQIIQRNPKSKSSEKLAIAHITKKHTYPSCLFAAGPQNLLNFLS